jgi:hypothetical protein
VSFFDQPLRVTRFKLVHALWRRQRMDVLPGVAPVALLLARTDNTVVALTDVRGYPNGFVFLLRVRWGRVADPFEDVPWPFPDWGSPDPLDAEPFPDELLRFGVEFADGRKVTNLDMYPFVPEDLPPTSRCWSRAAVKVARAAAWAGVPCGIWGWPSSPCRRLGRWPLCAPGRDEGSPRRGPRSTPDWSWTQPRRRCRSSQGHGREFQRAALAVPQRDAGDGAGGGDPGPNRADGGGGDRHPGLSGRVRVHAASPPADIRRRQGREFWPFHEIGPHRGPPWPDEVLRLTVQFADGRSVSSLDAPTGDAPDPDRPMLSSGPGTGGGVDGWSFDMEYRVRPLPPPGPLAFICAWPGRGATPPG